jgi:putative transposase
VSKTYQKKTAATNDEAVMPPLEAATIALTEIAESAREGLLALAVGTGLQVMQAWMNADVDVLCGPRSKHNAERVAYRHGTGAGAVTLGGRRVPVQRPRARSSDGSAELAVPAYELFSSTELLDEMAMVRMLAGLSTRRYRVGLEPVGTEVEATAASTSKSAVSRRFVRATETALAELMAADLHGLELVALMVDGVHFGEHCCVVALGIGMDGTKHPLAVEEGSTENATLVTDLLVGLRERGLDVTQAGAGGDRRVEGAAPRGARGVRSPGHRSVPAAQDPQRPRQAAGAAADHRGTAHPDRLPGRLGA